MKPSGDRLVPIETDRFTVGRSIKNTHAVYNGGNDEQGNTYSMFSFLYCSLTFTFGEKPRLHVFCFIRTK